MGVADIQAVHRWIDTAKRVVVLTGAGISTDSGIPDFRGPQGVWTRNPAAEKMSDIRYYIADREVRMASWQARLNSRWSRRHAPGATLGTAGRRVRESRKRWRTMPAKKQSHSSCSNASIVRRRTRSRTQAATVRNALR